MFKIHANNMTFKHVIISLSLLLALYVFVKLYPQVYERFIDERILCPTTNMSYDLRGDPYMPPRMQTPFNNSEIGPMDPSLCHDHNLVM
jgi:hypothetical protein